MVISRSKDFSIDDLSQNLENAIMANKIVPELTFKKELMKVVAKRVLPDISDIKLTEIYNRIEELTEADLIEKGEETTEDRSTKDIRQDIQEKWKRDNNNFTDAISVKNKTL